jgi:hypothetical protein
LDLQSHPCLIRVNLDRRGDRRGLFLRMESSDAGEAYTPIPKWHPQNCRVMSFPVGEPFLNATVSASCCILLWGMHFFFQQI